MKQLHSEIPELKTYIVIIGANQNKINVKNNFKQVKPDFFCHRHVCRHGLHNGVIHDIHVTIWLNSYPYNFYDVGGICESNFFMLKSQT